MEELTRRNIRYICFRIQTEVSGGTKAKKEKGIMKYVDDVKSHFESQGDFGGWDKFAKIWDVDEEDFLKAAPRKTSVQEEWEKVVEEEAKELPIKKKKKKKKKK